MILFDMNQVMQQADLHKNTSIAIIIYFIQNLQLSNSVVGAGMVMVVDHLNHATTAPPCCGVLLSKVIGAGAVGNSTFWQKWEG